MAVCRQNWPGWRNPSPGASTVLGYIVKRRHSIALGAEELNRRACVFERARLRAPQKGSIAIEGHHIGEYVANALFFRFYAHLRRSIVKGVSPIPRPLGGHVGEF